MYFKVLVFLSMVHLSSCADISPREISIEGVWTIEAQESFLNDYDTCYLGEQIEFLDNGYYIFKTNCNSEIPYGLINIGYYELKNDSILFYNERHALQVSTQITNLTIEELKVNYFVYERDGGQDLIEKKMIIKMVSHHQNYWID